MKTLELLRFSNELLFVSRFDRNKHENEENDFSKTWRTAWHWIENWYFMIVVVIVVKTHTQYDARANSKNNRARERKCRFIVFQKAMNGTLTTARESARVRRFESLCELSVYSNIVSIPFRRPKCVIEKTLVLYVCVFNYFNCQTDSVYRFDACERLCVTSVYEMNANVKMVKTFCFPWELSLVSKQFSSFVRLSNAMTSFDEHQHMHLPESKCLGRIPLKFWLTAIKIK